MKHHARAREIWRDFAPMRAGGGSKRAAGAVEASLALAAVAGDDVSGGAGSRVEAKRSRGLERAPSIKTTSSVTAVAPTAVASTGGAASGLQKQPAYATVVLADLEGAHTPAAAPSHLPT